MTIKIPEALQELAAELSLDLGDTSDDVNDLDDVVEWVREQIKDQRNEAIEEFDEFERRLDAIPINQAME